MIRRLIFLGHSELYGVPKGLCEAERLIASYPLYNAIGCLSRMELILIDPTFEVTTNLIENQKDICRRTCSLEQLKVIEKVAEETRIREKTDIILFHRPQLTSAMKLAFLNCPEEGKPPEYLHNLAEALFIINDRIGPTPQDKPTEYHLWVKQSQFVSSEVNLLYYLARWCTLAKKIETKQKQTQLGLEKRFKSKYGTDLTSFLTMGIDFYMQWVVLRPRQDIDNGIISIGVPQLENRSKLDKVEFDKSLQEFCQPPEFFKKSIRKEAELKDPYKNVTFLKKPLVRFENNIICLGKHFLTMKIGSGFYWLLVELYERGRENKSRREIMKLFGEAFSEYTMGILKRIYGNRTNCPLIDVDKIDNFQNKQAKRKADALIICGDSLIVVEFKSSLFPVKLLSSNKVDDFHEWEREHLLEDGTKQIYSLIIQLIKSEIPKLNVAQRVKKYYPLIITLQQLPTAVPTYISHFEKEAETLKNRELESADVRLNGIRIEPINLMSVSELEQIEAIFVTPGCQENLKDIIDRKNQKDRYSNWLPFLQEYFNKYNTPVNTHLINSLKEFVHEGLEQIFPPKETSK